MRSYVERIIANVPNIIWSHIIITLANAKPRLVQYTVMERAHPHARTIVFNHKCVKCVRANNSQKRASVKRAKCAYVQIYVGVGISRAVE